MVYKMTNRVTKIYTNQHILQSDRIILLLTQKTHTRKSKLLKNVVNEIYNKMSIVIYELTNSIQFYDNLIHMNYFIL